MTLALEQTIGEQLERRRKAAAEAWDLSEEIVLVGAGAPVHLPGRADLTYRFRAHSENLYLTDRERPGGVLAFDPAEGWADFVEPVSRDEQLWEGAAEGDGEGVPVTELPAWLEARKARRIACLGAAPAPSDAELEASVRAALNRIRRPKDELELSRMRAAERATSAGFAALPQQIDRE